MSKIEIGNYNKKTENLRLLCRISTQAQAGEEKEIAAIKSVILAKAGTHFGFNS